MARIFERESCVSDVMEFDICRGSFFGDFYFAFRNMKRRRILVNIPRQEVANFRM